METTSTHLTSTTPADPYPYPPLSPTAPNLQPYTPLDPSPSVNLLHLACTKVTIHVQIINHSCTFCQCAKDPRSENCRKFSPANRRHHDWEPIHQSSMGRVTIDAIGQCG